MDSRTSRLNPLGTSFTETHWELSDPGSDTSELFQARQRTPVRSTPEIRKTNNFAGRKTKNAPPITGLSPGIFLFWNFLDALFLEKLDAKCVENTSRLEDVPKIDLNSSRCQVDPFYEHVSQPQNAPYSKNRIWSISRTRQNIFVYRNL